MLLDNFSEGSLVVRVRLEHLDNCLCADFECLERVATFENNGQAALYFSEALGHPGIANG